MKLSDQSVSVKMRLFAGVDLPAMRVNLLYFASFRDAAGLSEQVRELPEGTRVGQLWEAVARDIPRLAAFPTMPPAAVNREYVDGETVLIDGDEVAFLPPVAGG
jgi:molybdopterin converting factor subunit 1